MKLIKEIKEIPTGTAVFLLIAGVIMGTVFTFGMKYWNAPITKDEAQQVTAIFSSFEEIYGRGGVNGIIVRFENHEQLEIDGVCINDEISDAIDDIVPGTIVEMLVHPNSDSIVEMKVGNMKVLDFQDSIQKLSSEASGFMYIGVFCYIMALLGAGHFILLKKK